MVYTTGTITDTDAAAVGLAMANRIRDDVVAHVAWELVEEFTAASGTVRWYVFKCLATESGLPADYYVVMGRTLSTGELKFTFGESYNSTTHTLQYYPAVLFSSSPAFDAQGRSPSTFVLGANPFTFANTTPNYSSWLPSGTSVNWWLVVAEDGFTVACNGASNAFIHIGTYEPLGAQEDAIAMPLQIIGSSGSTGAIARNPALASSSASVTGITSGFVISGGGGSAASTGNGSPALGFEGSLVKNDKLQNNLRLMAEVGIVIGNASGNEDVIGFALGKQKRMRISTRNPPTGTAFGDTWAMEGTLWVPYKPNDGRLFDTGVAV